MAQKILISDNNLSRRADEIVSELRERYPDGKISGLNARYKTLSNKVGELWQQIGYASRDDFFAAYGFEFVRASNQTGGRPISVDGEKVIAELMARYEDVPKPKSLGILIYENPDLKGKLKTLQNKSNEIFGKTLAKELKERGILSNESASVEVSEGDIKAMLDCLAAKYADAAIKPSNITELKADNPEFKNAIVAFNGRCKMMFGVAPKAKFVELGIYPKPKSAVVDASVEEIEKAIDELGEILCDTPAYDKPRNITDLIKAYPEQGKLIKAGKNKAIVDKASLQLLGILAPTKALLKKQGVRSVPSDELLPLFVEVADKLYIEPGDDATDCLPPTVIGIDVKEGVELRTALIAIKDSPAGNANVGDKFKAKVVAQATPWGDQYHCIQVDGYPRTEVKPVDVGSAYDDAVSESASKLANFTGAAVVSKFEHEGTFIAQLEFIYLAALRSNTMIYLLRTRGIVTDADLVGGMGWRFRLRKIKRGDASTREVAKSSSRTPATSVAAELHLAGTALHIEINVSQKKPGPCAEKFEAKPESSRVVIPLSNERKDERISYGLSAKADAKDETDRATLHKPADDSTLRYLKALGELLEREMKVRSVDLADAAGVSKAAVAKALPKLISSGFVAKDIDGYLILTEDGCNEIGIQHVAEKQDDARYAFETDAALTESQRKYLQVIADINERVGQVNSTDIAKELGCSKASVSKAISRLESLGYVERNGRLLNLTERAIGEDSAAQADEC